MARGITGILFTDEDLETGQIKEYPSLKNCRVYGVMANSLFAYIEAGIVEESRNRSEILKEKGYKNSGIKWVYGRVNSLEKGGIEWLHWFSDTNQNNKKDPGEQNIENEPLIKISGSDLYGVGGAYNRADSISLWFDKDEKFLPALYWVEPFLVHPELHFGAAPKGMFMMPAQHPGPYEVTISGNHTVHRGAFSRILASTVKQAKYTYLYYGENIEFFIETLHIPEGEKLSVEIWDESSDKTLYSTTATVTKNKPAQEEEETDELQDYLEQFKGFAEVTVPLDISKMPEDQKKKEARVFKVQISYLPSDFSLINEMGGVIAASEISSAVISSRTRKELANKPRVQSVTGYIQIMYEDTEAYISTRNAPVNNVVEKETPVLLAPKGEPCHYTQIKAQRYKEEGFSKKDGSDSVIFDETKMILPKSQPTIEVIAGDAKPAFLKLMADLHTNEACRPGTHTRGGKSVFYFHKEASAEQQNLTVVNIKEKEIDLSLPYIYIKDKKVANTVSSFPFNYFWLIKKDKQPYVVMIKTCRYTNDVLINVYPDIKWEVYVFLIPTESDSYSHANMPAGDIFKRHQDKARKIGIAHKNKDVNFTWEVHVKYTVSGLVYDYGINLNQKIRKYLDAIGVIKDILDTLSNRKKIVEGEGNNAQNMIAKVGKKNKIPIFIEFSLPSFRVGGSWYYKTDKNEVQSTGNLELGLAPLIKAKGGIDLIAAVSYIPVVGQILRALGYVKMGLEWVSSKVGTPVVADLWFNIYAFGQVDIKWILALKDFSAELQPSITLGMGVELGFKIEARVKKVILINGQKEEKTVGGMKGELSGTAETGLKLTINTNKQKVSGFFTFLGVTMKIVGTLEILDPGSSKKLPKISDSYSIIPYKKFGDFEFDLLDFK
ncbi:hypothetical protein [Apibacter adventoris]|uniref:Uncharacterized protein n=1 Tax=Apibacter adventoris TaxID=1679466 RepID=A0A2S8AE46_9FLAO|nr:hypothetical protein [Apibacter adventoris]PQL93226.1 hypothetical protein C4S77_06080 [Apibacter adventoris]